ncbi:hypothetical protein GCM10023194_81130 [Planotetraspora phitsanulokensis]
MAGPRGGRGSGGSSGSSLLRSLGGGTKGSRAFARRTSDSGGKSSLGGLGKGKGGPHSGSPKGLGLASGKDAKGHKSARSGKTVWDEDTKTRPKRRKGSSGQVELRPRRTADPAVTSGKPSKTKNPNGTPDKGAKPATARKVTWKAPKEGSGKGATAGPKRWTTGRPGTSDKAAPNPTPPNGPRRRKSTWKASTDSAGPKRWTSSKNATGSRADQDKERAQEQATPPPPPGFAGMRPPPAADRTVRVESSERVDQPRQRKHEALALTQEGVRALSAAPKTNTQYRDAELTVYDVIEADADMAEQILDGVAEAEATAEGCDLLRNRLEALHAEIGELKVPGVLLGMVARLMEKTATVKAKAEAIAENLPRASEAISIAGSNAEARHKNPADVTRDMGHTRPAERDYHNE